MKFDVTKIFEELVGSFVKLPLAQKIALPLVIAGSVGTIVFVAQWAGRPEYRNLYSNLEEADSAAVVEHLKEKKISYALRDDGKTIDVTPVSVVNDVKLELASAGLPSGKTKGFELFNEVSLGQTAFDELIKRQRALQGELERTIGTITAIRNVRVHITSPKESLFMKKDSMPTASVLIGLKPGADITPRQVKGIAHLVSGSVERLTPDNVTIIDTKGNMLNEKSDEEELGGADVKKLDYQRQLEAAYAKRIETMLAEVLGPGRAIARVTADMDFNRYEKEEHAYDPAGQVTRSERSVEESAGLSAEGGVPGVVSNLTNDQGVLTPPDSAKNSNIRKESLKNYELTSATSRMVGSVGKVNRLSVAVLVDGQYKNLPPAVEGEVPGRQYSPLSAEMMRKIDNLVRQSVGFDVNRGDTVTVENIRFVVPDESLSDVLSKDWMWTTIWNALGYLGPIIAVLLFFMVFVKPLVRFLLSPTDAEIDLSRLLPAGIEELEAELDQERSKLGSVDRGVPSIDIEELEELLSENSRIVKENPQQAALLIRYWLNDGRI